MKLEVTAKRMDKCNIFKEGEKFVVEGAEVKMDESDKICVYALSSFLPILTAILKGARFEDNQNFREILCAEIALQFYAFRDWQRRHRKVEMYRGRWWGGI